MGDLPWWAYLVGVGFWVFVWLRRRRFNANRLTAVTGDRHRSIKGGF